MITFWTVRIARSVTDVLQCDWPVILITENYRQFTDNYFLQTTDEKFLLSVFAAK